MRKLLLLLFTVIMIVSTLSAQNMHLYGGKNHDVYLGCLTSNEYDSESVWNSYGTYGSKHNTKSIWNNYGTYGGKYGTYSPWSTTCSTPPIVVDKAGKFYGYLTVNKYHKDRATFELALYLYEYHEFIADDVSKWYKKIFE